MEYSYWPIRQLLCIILEEVEYMPKVSGSHLIVESLKKEGIKNLFILAGDHILPVLYVMEDFDFKFYDTRHEQ